MERDRFINFALWIAAFFAAVMLMAVPGLAMDPVRHQLWLACFFIGLSLTLVSLIVALIAAVGDRDEIELLERRKKMFPLIGMVASAILFVGFAGWFFWPVPKNKPNLSAPLALVDSEAAGASFSKLMVSRFEPQPSVGELRPFKMVFANKGNLDAEYPQIYVAGLPADGLGIASKVEAAIAPTIEAAQKRKYSSNGNQIFVGNEVFFILATPMSEDRFTLFKAGKIEIGLFILLKYSDSGLSKGQARYTYFCAYFKDAAMAFWDYCDSHNRFLTGPD